MVHPARRLSGQLTLPGDKSISHRYAILCGMAAGSSRISNYSPSLDCRSTLQCLETLGVATSGNPATVWIDSPGWPSFQPPRGVLDTGNSGTGMRLLSGLLCGCPFLSTITGDKSLRRRPMARIIEPLSRMGAEIESRAGGLPPLVIRGGALRGIRYRPPVASAQVKSSVLLAGLCARGTTEIEEIAATRDHTERALPIFGVGVERDGLCCSIRGPRELKAVEVEVPGDFSAAAFFLVAALLIPGSKLRLQGVGINPTRTGLLQLLEKAGAPISRENPRMRHGEPVCDLVAVYSRRFTSAFPAEIGADWVPNLIDEIPVLAVLGTALEGGLRIRDAAELRKKESDRIEAVVSNLRSLGVQAEEFKDGLFVPSSRKLQGGRVRTCKDHRIAMAFAVGALAARGPIELDDADCCAVSYPSFFEDLEAVAQR